MRSVRNWNRGVSDIKRTKFARGKRAEILQPLRAYELRSGDIFTIEDRHVLEALCHSNSRHIFLPLRRYRKVIWYRPRTWFRRFWDIQYIEFREEADGNAGDLAETREL